LKASQFTVGGLFLFGDFNKKYIWFRGMEGEHQLLESFQVKGAVKIWNKMDELCFGYVA
jgi:hypothetical protein